MQNTERSLSWDLAQGAMDGTIKSLTPDQGGAVNEYWANKRTELGEGNTAPLGDAWDVPFLNPQARQRYVLSQHGRYGKPHTLDADYGVSPIG
jgi:hypothetical protein